MGVNVIPLKRRKKSKLEKVILRKEGDVLYVDFVLTSMVESIKKWYAEHFQMDSKCRTMIKAHILIINRRYNSKRFRNYKTLGKERAGYLEEIDLYVQMRRDD